MLGDTRRDLKSFLTTKEGATQASWTNSRGSQEGRIRGGDETPATEGMSSDHETLSESTITSARR